MNHNSPFRDRMAKLTHEVATDGLREHDLIGHPLDLTHVKEALAELQEAFLHFLNLHTRLIAECEMLRVRATRDPLTGVLNRAGILDTLERELVRASRDGLPVGVFMVDLDHFKQVNDVHGHLTGDTVLCETAQRISSLMRPYDAVGRYGGDEFFVIVPACDVSSTAELAERLRSCLEKEPVIITEGFIHVTSSFGVAAYDGTEGTNVGVLLRAVDAALYQAKHRGGNRIATARDLPVQEKEHWKALE